VGSRKDGEVECLGCKVGCRFQRDFPRLLHRRGHLLTSIRRAKDRSLLRPVRTTGAGGFEAPGCGLGQSLATRIDGQSVCCKNERTERTGGCQSRSLIEAVATPGPIATPEEGLIFCLYQRSDRRLVPWLDVFCGSPARFW
jgi:hypothetical protein